MPIQIMDPKSHKGNVELITINWILVAGLFLFKGVDNRHTFIFLLLFQFFVPISIFHVPLSKVTCWSLRTACATIIHPKLPNNNNNKLVIT